MITVWALVWFFATTEGNVIAPTQIYSSLEECKTAGDATYAYSEQLQSEKKITTYAGACHEVQVNTKAGSI